MNLRISNILTSSDFESFKALFQESITPLYPNSTEKSANSIIEKHKLGIDPDGYFTIRKTLWKGISNEDETIAFSVISEKRGGSIKFGPTIVNKSKRGKGIGASFRSLIENEYSSRGFRKSYSTTNLTNLPAILYILKIGYKIELHLKNHYSKNADELVLSKSIGESNSSLNSSTTDLPDVPEFVANYMLKYYDGIDKLFFYNIEKTLTDRFDLSEDFFINKQKHKFLDNTKNLYAIVTPKRGGCAKISPLILNADSSVNNDFIKSLLEQYQDTEIHKFYTFIPIGRTNEIEILKSNGFYAEGIISEPYKIGVDLIILSYFKR